MTTWSELQDVTVNGTSIKNYGYGMRLNGGLDSLPDLSGENLRAAYRRGRIWVPKTRDQATRTLSMWIDSRHPDSELVDDDYAQRIRQRNANVRAVLAMFGYEGAPVTVVRQMLLPASLGGDQSWTSMAEAGRGFAPEWSDQSDEEAFFTVDLTFHDPVWRGAPIPLTLTKGAAATPVAYLGTIPADDSVVTFNASTGGLSNPEITNGTAYLRIGVDIAVGDSVVVDCGNATAIRTSDSANLIGAVTHSGNRSFMRLNPGNNTLALIASSGTGTADIVYRHSFY